MNINIIGENLKSGDTGEKVAFLQQILQNLGWDYEIDVAELTDQRFGDTTLSVLLDFQRRKGLLESGIADELTATKLTHIFEHTPSIKYVPTGHVRDEKGNKAGGLRTEVWNITEKGERLLQSAQTGEDGIFRFFFTEREAHVNDLHQSPGLFFRLYKENRLLYDGNKQEDYWHPGEPTDLNIEVDLRAEELMLEQLQWEDRITRLCLIGSGIVCGLELCMDHNFGIQVRTGNGITSDGRYVEVERIHTFRYYRAFEKDGYPLFEQASDVWELLETPEENSESLHPQNEEEELNPFLREKVVVLYLAPDEEAEESLRYKLRFLLMSQEDVTRALQVDQLAIRLLWEQLEDDNDFIYNSDYNPDDARPNIDILNLSMNPAYRLPELYLRRLGFNKGDAYDCPPDVNIDDSVFPEIASLENLYDAYVPIIDEATQDLDAALNKLMDNFGNLMDCKDKDRVQSWIDELCLKWEAYKMEQVEAETEESLIPNKKYYIQYFYDWVRDLIQGYNELRQDLMNLVNECCPNLNEFPRHLFLGIALRHELSRQPQPLRHHFQQPPIYNGNADRLHRIRLYCWRELMMIKTFYLPDYLQNPEINPYSDPGIDPEELPDFSNIKITPGRFYDAPLAEQSIPFYYPLNWSPYSVHYFWNYERTKTSSTDQLLSYHAADLEGESYTLLPNAIRPLHYRLDRYPFFRVEGHIGRALNNIYSYSCERTEELSDNDIPTCESSVQIGVIEELNYIKQKYNLPICFRTVDVTQLIEVKEANDIGKYAYKYPEVKRDENDEVINNYIDALQLPFEDYFSFKPNLLGSEHCAGVKNNGIFIIAYEKKNITLFNNLGEEEEKEAMIAIADFFLEDCCSEISQEEFGDIIIEPKEDAKDESAKNSGESSKLKKLISYRNTDEHSLIAKLGSAKMAEKDDLTAIKGIGTQYEIQLNEIGIYTYKQISKMTDKEYEAVDEILGGVKGKGKRYNWAEQAKKLIS